MFDIDEEITRPTYLEVSVANFRYNIAQIRKMVGEGIEIMPVIKANAYGTYLNRRMDLMEQFNIVAVANVVDKPLTLIAHDNDNAAQS